MAKLTVPQLIDLCLKKAAPNVAEFVDKQEWPQSGAPYRFEPARRGTGVVFVITDPGRDDPEDPAKSEDPRFTTARGATKEEAVRAMVAQLGLDAAVQAAEKE